MRVTFQGLQSERHFAFQEGNILTSVAEEKKNINLSIRQEKCREKMSFDKRSHRILVVQMCHICKKRLPEVLNSTLPAMMKQFAVRYTYCIMCCGVLESSIKFLFL